MDKSRLSKYELETYEDYICRKEYWDDFSAEWHTSTIEQKIISLGHFVQQGGSLLRLLNRYAKSHDEMYRQRIQYCILKYLKTLIKYGFDPHNPFIDRIKCLDKKELVDFFKIELKSRVRKSTEMDRNGRYKDVWIIDQECLNPNKPKFTDSVLLDKIQIPYWRAHPEESFSTYQQRIQKHWDGAYAKSLW